MKTIKYNEYKNDGIFINLETDYIPYQKLIYDHSKYLSKNNKYYILCKNGIKSREVVKKLELLGYDVTQVIKPKVL